MASTYSNDKTGIKVVAGTIKSIEADGLTMVIATEERNKDGQVSAVEKTIRTDAAPFTAEEGYKVGREATAIGYPSKGGTILADAVLVGNQIYETEGLTVITGLVKRARFNEEKNEDGTPKMTRGSEEQAPHAKKPHFDITVTVKDIPTGNYVDHRVKVYEGNAEEGKTSQLDRAKKLFSRFDAKENRIAVSIVTTPGREYSLPYTKKDGSEGISYYCDHMGYKKLMNINYIDSKERAKTAPQADKSGQETPVKEEVPAPAPVTNEPNGFENATEFTVDEMEMFS